MTSVAMLCAVEMRNAIQRNDLKLHFLQLSKMKIYSCMHLFVSLCYPYVNKVLFVSFLSTRMYPCVCGMLLICYAYLPVLWSWSAISKQRYVLGIWIQFILINPTNDPFLLPYFVVVLTLSKNLFDFKGFW